MELAKGGGRRGNKLHNEISIATGNLAKPGLREIELIREPDC